jgi:hypothetical protein
MKCSLVEDIFFRTSSSLPGGASSGPSRAAGKWPLMTRSHLAQALVCVSLKEKDANLTVCLIGLFVISLYQILRLTGFYGFIIGRRSVWFIF